MKHRLHPKPRAMGDAEGPTTWVCAYCHKEWSEIDANAWFEDCPIIKENPHG